MKILHIIRNPNDTTPFEMAKSQSVEHDVAILLLHDAVYLSPDFRAFACEADARARGVNLLEYVDYKGIVKMLFEYDKAVSW